MIRILLHAKERMGKYNISDKLVRETLTRPDNVIKGRSGRLIAQKRLNNYILRVIYELDKKTKVVVTVYKARSERYET